MRLPCISGSACTGKRLISEIRYMYRIRLCLCGIYTENSIVISDNHVNIRGVTRIKDLHSGVCQWFGQFIDNLADECLCRCIYSNKDYRGK